jgi:DNA-binding NarL/FixJ family response regulator
MLRAVVLGDDATAIESLKRTLGSLPDLELVGEFALRGSERKIEAVAPGLIFIDEPAWTPLPLAIIREARCAAPTAVVIVRAADPTAVWLADALLAGASVVLPAVDDPATLRQVTNEAVAARETDPAAFRLGWAA